MLNILLVHIVLEVKNWFLKPVPTFFVHQIVTGNFFLLLMLYLLCAGFVGAVNQLMLLLGLDQRSALKEEV